MSRIQPTGSAIIGPAKISDLDELSTILPRSFFPVNPIIKEALPDTNSMRQWWKQVYEEEIANESCHVLVAREVTSGKTIAVTTMRLIQNSDDIGGFWSRHPWTEDHRGDLWQAPIDCMSHYEKELMHDQPHFLLELMAVDHEYKDLRLGTRLVQHACDIADGARLPIFLQSGGASGFYLKLGLGFTISAQPTWEGYKATLLVRQCTSCVI